MESAQAEAFLADLIFWKSSLSNQNQALNVIFDDLYSCVEL